MSAAAETVMIGSMGGKLCGLFKRLRCFGKCSKNDNEDGSDTGHDIQCKCVLSCCGGAVSDNDFTSSNNRSVHERKEGRKKEVKEQKTFTCKIKRDRS